MVTALWGKAGLFAFAALLLVLTACGRGGPPAGTHPNDARPGTIDVTLDTFVVKPNVTTIHTGALTFNVNNASGLTHEMLVVRVADLPPEGRDPKVASVNQVVMPGEGAAEEALVAALMGEAYDRLSSRLVEDKIGSLGEVADIGGGTSGSVTLDVPPGQYLLLCNITAHFQAGMHTRLVVLP